jgi:hypothetical protein
MRRPADVRNLSSLRAPRPTRLLYQKLIDPYLLDCAKNRMKLTMKWVAQRKIL